MPTERSGAEALSYAVLPADMRVWLSDPEGDGSYPIATFTWMLFYKKNDDANKLKAIHDIINYGLSDGQKISGKMGYIPLPPNVVEEVQKAAENIK
jgi:phosphate transport system substrate-binding protein